MSASSHTEQRDLGAADRLVLEPVADLASVEREWRALAERSGNVFHTWEWTELWWRHFGQGRPFLLRVVRTPDGEPVAILPLYLASGRPLRTVRFIGSGGAAHELGPICAAADRPLVARALCRALAEAGHGWDLFIGDFLPGADDWGEMTGYRTIATSPSPVAQIGGTSWEEYFNSKSYKFRRTIRNFERRLSRDWGLRYRLSDDASRIDAEMSALYELHERRWAGEPGGDYERISRFERELAPLALRLGWLRLWTMELDDRPAVALFGLRYGDSEWALRIGRDPDPRRRNLSVGLVLFAHAIKAACEDGMRLYRLGRGASDYKARLSDADPGLDQLTTARGLRGRLALWGAGARDSLPVWARRRLVNPASRPRRRFASPAGGA
jgi:CelD/BcsL family acetyltransferase involved in cellulose biosynthesis